MFQSTRPWATASFRPEVGGICFNPRAREGRDLDVLEDLHDAIVSIHAPVKGATRVAVRRDKRIDVSIHAPVKGATPYRPLKKSVPRGFNPRAREGRDP